MRLPHLPSFFNGQSLLVILLTQQMPLLPIITANSVGYLPHPRYWRAGRVLCGVLPSGATLFCGDMPERPETLVRKWHIGECSERFGSKRTCVVRGGERRLERVLTCFLLATVSLGELR